MRGALELLRVGGLLLLGQSPARDWVWGTRAGLAGPKHWSGRGKTVAREIPPERTFALVWPSGERLFEGAGFQEDQRHQNTFRAFVLDSLGQRALNELGGNWTGAQAWMDPAVALPRLGCWGGRERLAT